MVGNTVDPILSSTEDDSSLGLSCFLRGNDLSTKVEDGSVHGEDRLVLGEFDNEGRQISSDSLEQRRIENVYEEVLRSYDELRRRSESLEEAKSKILSYTPGSWIEEVGGMKLSDYDVPNTTSLLLIGPEGSGKSSLVNKISRVFETDKFASERAQVSYNSSVGDGTYFLREYMIPRGSTSFCLYDTRSISDNSYKYMEMLERWMTKGVRHGELAISCFDGSSLKDRIKCKARQNDHNSSVVRMVNFVIFVVNGLSVLKSMDSDDRAGRQCTQIITETFNSPYLSFKDDKPVIVVTHGDLLSLRDRALVRVHLGELLGIPPKTQIFDIPESCDPVTELTIVDMLRYCLQHADRNFPCKGRLMGKVRTAPIRKCSIL